MTRVFAAVAVVSALSSSSCLLMAYKGIERQRCSSVRSREDCLASSYAVGSREPIRHAGN